MRRSRRKGQLPAVATPPKPTREWRALIAYRQGLVGRRVAAQNRIRALVQARVPGTVATSPFGSNIRSIVVSVDPDKLRAYNAFLEVQFSHSDLHYSVDSPSAGRGGPGSSLELRRLGRWESPERRFGIGSRLIVLPQLRGGTNILSLTVWQSALP